MKKVIIYFFSGTYNTRYVAEKYAESFTKVGCSVTLCDVTAKSQFVAPDEFDLVGLGYPIHAFNCPELFYKFVKNANIVGKDYFIFKVSGEPLPLNDGSSHLIVRKLAKNNCLLVGETHFLMPYNIMFRHDDGLVAQMVFYAEKLAEGNVNELMNGQAPRIEHTFWSRVVSFLFRIEWFGAKLNGFFYHADSKCVKCGKCVNNCPTCNIKAKSDRLEFGGKCAMCMRCVLNCPIDAIHIGLFNGWKVSGAYDFDKICAKRFNRFDYITCDTQGWQKCYYEYFLRLDERLKVNYMEEIFCSGLSPFDNQTADNCDTDDEIKAKI